MDIGDYNGHCKGSYHPEAGVGEEVEGAEERRDAADVLESIKHGLGFELGVEMR